MKIENRQQFLVMLTIAAVALFVGVNFILTPLGGWWSSRQVQIRDLRTKVSDGQRLVKRETLDRNRWDGMQKNSLPSNTSLAEQQLFKAVDDWSRSSGVEVASITPQWKNESTNYLTLTCRVETSGNLSALSRFLYDLEEGQMALRLDSVELSAKDKDGLQMTMGTDINGLVLLQQNTK